MPTQFVYIPVHIYVYVCVCVCMCVCVCVCVSNVITQAFFVERALLDWGFDN